MTVGEQAAQGTDQTVPIGGNDSVGEGRRLVGVSLALFQRLFPAQRRIVDEPLSGLGAGEVLSPGATAGA